jgi:hypothetical protein
MIQMCMHQDMLIHSPTGPTLRVERREIIDDWMLCEEVRPRDACRTVRMPFGRSL